MKRIEHAREAIAAVTTNQPKESMSMDEQLRELAAAISTAIRQALTAGVDPQDILRVLDEHLDNLEEQQV